MVSCGLGKLRRTGHNRVVDPGHAADTGRGKWTMTTMAAIPVTVAPEARAQIEELGREQEFALMLEQLRRIVPGLRAIEVTFEHYPDQSDDPMVVLATYQPSPQSDLDPTDQQWGSWFLQTFPPDVVRHFVRLAVYEASDGR